MNILAAIWREERMLKKLNGEPAKQMALPKERLALPGA